MLNWFRNNHGITAIGSSIVGLFALAQQAASAGILNAHATAIVTGLSIIIAAFAQKPGTPR